jgi:hypothetical protein
MRSSICFPLLFLCAASVDARAQLSIQSGPEITAISGTSAVIAVQLTAPAPAEIQYWTDANSAVATIQHVSSTKGHEFPIPASPIQYYRVIIKNADGTEAIRTQQFSTAAANLPSAAISLGSPTVINGNILSVPADASRLGELAASWKSEDGSGGSVTKPINPGHSDILIDLPAPNTGSKIVSVTLRAASGGIVVSDLGTKPYSVSPSTATFSIGAGSVKPSLSGVLFTVPISSPSIQSINYQVTLRTNEFERKFPGTCQLPQCSITVNGLSPATNYTYSLQFTAGGVTQSYSSIAPLAFATTAEPSLVGGPKLEFTTTGFRVLATTTDSARAELVYIDSTGSTITSRQTNFGLNHTITVAQGLAFNSSGTAETTLELVLRTPAGTQISRYPFGFKMATAPVSTASAARSFGNRKVKDILSAVGPAALAFLGVPAPLVNALRQ